MRFNGGEKQSGAFMDLEDLCNAIGVLGSASSCGTIEIHVFWPSVVYSGISRLMCCKLYPMDNALPLNLSL